ncbi:MAG TPA: cupin domain-containing protein [Candidatus Limnocylindria bacterium]|nr:cupin domain-containing protein [Candidatus Limnocylindria bacterium]
MEYFHRTAERVAFAPDKMAKTNLVDTPNLFCDLYAFEPGQAQAVHRHAVGDKLYYVLEGTGRIRVDGDERAVVAGDLVCAPAGSEHGVRNPGPGRLTLLVVMAPKPSKS